MSHIITDFLTTENIERRSKDRRNAAKEIAIRAAMVNVLMFVLGMLVASTIVGQ